MTGSKHIFPTTLCLLACVLSACARQIEDTLGGLARSTESSSCGITRLFGDAMGGLAREHVETLGTPDKKCSLVKLRVSKSYAVAIEQNYLIRLGEEYPRVRVVKQFSDSGKDYAIIECGKEDGTLKNMLLAMPYSPKASKLYYLDSASNKPFRMELGQNRAILLQETGDPKQTRAWFIDYAGVRGPTLLSSATPAAKERARTQPDGAGKAAKQRAQRSPDLPPLIVPDASAKLEYDGPRQADKAAPVIVIDGAPPAAAKPADKPTPQSGSAPEPKPTQQPASVPEPKSDSQKPVIVIH